MTWLNIGLGVLGVVLAALATAFQNARAAQQSSQDSKDAAVNGAAANTNQDTAVIADAQASNNATDRGTASDVAARLRERLAGK